MNALNFSIHDVVHTLEERDKWLKKVYYVQLQQCIDEIWLCKLSQNFLVFLCPENMVDNPFYNSNDCAKYIKESLLQAGFYCRICLPGNKLYISWDIKDQVKVQKYLATKKVLDEPIQETQPTTFHIVEYDPCNPLDKVKAMAKIMETNPKYKKIE